MYKQMDIGIICMKHVYPQPHFLKNSWMQMWLALCTWWIRDRGKTLLAQVERWQPEQPSVPDSSQLASIFPHYSEWQHDSWPINQEHLSLGRSNSAPAPPLTCTSTRTKLQWLDLRQFLCGAESAEATTATGTTKVVCRHAEEAS